MSNFNWPINPTTFNAGPIQFEIDGVPTVVSTDTDTPADSRPLPVIITNPDGTQPAGLATEAKQDDQLTILETLATEGTLQAIETNTGDTVTELVSANSTLADIESALAPLATEITLVDVADNTNGINVATQSMDGKTPPLGQATMTASVPVVIASNQSPVPVTVGNFPAGLATEAKQDDEIAELVSLNAVDFATETTLQLVETELQDVNTNLASIDSELVQISGQIPATLGQKTSANSLAVVLASDQTPLPAPAVPGALTVKQAAVSFGISAVRLTTDGSAPSSTRRKLQFIIEPPAGDVNYFMGSNSVTSSGGTRGPRLYPGTLYTYDNDSNDYYIVSDTASQTVFVLEDE